MKVSGGKVHSRSDGRREGKEGGKRRRVRSRSYGETESVKERCGGKELQRCGAKEGSWRERKFSAGEGKKNRVRSGAGKKKKVKMRGRN